VSYKTTKWIKISLTVLSIVLPFGYTSSVLLADGGPITNTQQRLAGAMVVKALVFVVFANLMIWGWSKRSGSKH
jgi:hypothetical protein